jgi:hypothetical protein
LHGVRPIDKLSEQACAIRLRRAAAINDILKRPKRLINLSCNHTPIRFPDDVDGSDLGHLCSACKATFNANGLIERAQSTVPFFTYS